MNRALLTLACAAALLATGCETLKQAGQGVAALGQSAGVLTPDQAKSLERSTTAVARSFEDLNSEQEYYIGRAVGATVLSQYKPFDEKQATRYVNTLGQALATYSDKPETYCGYRFLLLDTDDITAFAAPGGLIFVSRAMIRCCDNEDMLAAVLAHEIGHVQNEDGLRAIKGSRLTSALGILASEGTKTFGGEQLAQLTDAFEDSIGDIAGTMINSGYSRGQERAADRAAVTILQRAGYDPFALVAMLNKMKQQLKPGGHDFAKTHPDPADRVRDLKKLLEDATPAAIPEVRTARFKKTMRGV